MAEKNSTARRVLVAGEDDLDRALLKAALGMLGVEVVWVPDGVRALEAARTGDFDLAILDLRMPILDGLGTLRRIRALPGERGAVPVVAVGTAGAEARALLMAAGLDGFLRKPIDWRALSATVRALWAPDALPTQRRA